MVGRSEMQMITKLLKKVSKLFLGFLCIFLVLGILMFLVRDYSIPVISAVNASNGGAITKTFRITGNVIAQNTIEVKAPEKLYVKEINAESSQIVNANIPIIVFDTEKFMGNVKNNLQVSEDGVYRVNKNIYIEYINDKDVIEEGEVIIKYSVHDVDNLEIVTEVKDNVLYSLTSQNTKIYYYKNNYSERVKANISDIKKFPDYNRVYFSLNEKSNEKININNTANIVVESREEYSAIIVPVTALIPIGEIKDNTSCYVYGIIEEDTIFGKQSRVILRDAYIYSIGSSRAAIYINNDDNMITDYKQLRIVNYATSAIKNGSRVRVK